MEKVDAYHYSLLITDQSDKSDIRSIKSMVLALSYSDNLWRNVEFNYSNESGILKDLNLEIQITSKKEHTKEQSVLTGFLLNAQSKSFEILESFRRPLLVHLNKLNFSNITILNDEVSNKIYTEVFFMVSNVETELRTYLTKYCILKTGLSWWGSTIRRNILDKLSERISINNPYAPYADAEIMLMDFKELGELSKTVLQNELFVKLWDTLSSLRNRVIQRSLFEQSDLISAKEIYNQLKEVINNSRDRKLVFQSSSLKPSENNFIQDPLKTSKNGKDLKEDIDVNHIIPPIKAEYSKPTVENFTETSYPEPEIKSAPLPILDIDKNITKEIVQSISDITVQPKEINANESIPAPASATEVNNIKQEPIKEDVTVQQVVENKKVTEKPAEPAQNAYVDAYRFISENELISELKQYERTQSPVDFKLFATKILGAKGFATGSVYSMSRTLNEKGKLRIYDAKDEKGLTIKAIKSV